MTAPALTTARTVGADRRASSTDLQSFVSLLEAQKASTLDLVVPADKISMEDGVLQVVQPDIVRGDANAPEIFGAGTYRYCVTDVADDGLSSRLDIPREYLRRNRFGGVIGKKKKTPNLPLYDGLVNLSLAPQGNGSLYLLRLLTGAVLDDTGEKVSDGYVRAFLTNGYKIIDNFDVLVATLQGITMAGIDPKSLKISADLDERRMYVRVEAPEVKVAAADLLANYRSPYKDPETGRHLTGLELPYVYAGFTLTNSESGHGAYSLTPQSVVEICGNGQTWTSEAMRKPHLGERLEAGHIKWSEETQRLHLASIRSKAADTVKHFLSVGFLEERIDKMREAAGVEIDMDAHENAVEVVAKECAFTEGEAAAVLADFGFGGDSTVGGMVQAVTSAAQRQASPERQWALETSTEKVYALAGVLHRL